MACNIASLRHARPTQMLAWTDKSYEFTVPGGICRVPGMRALESKKPEEKFENWVRDSHRIVGMILEIGRQPINEIRILLSSKPHMPIGNGAEKISRPHALGLTIADCFALKVDNQLLEQVVAIILRDNDYRDLANIS